MMSEWVTGLLLRVRALFRRRQLDADLDEELHFHVASREQELRESGLDADEASRLARQRFGNATGTKEATRELWVFPTVETIWKDVRYAIRTLGKTPVFSAVAVVLLALGIGANTALFSLMDAMLLRALPVKDPQQIVEFVRAHPDGAMMTNLPYPVFEYLRRDQNVLADIFAIRESSPVFQADAAPSRTTAHEVSGSFFPGLGVHALMGRTIGPDDDRPGSASRVAVISYGFWSRQFGRDPSALGSSVRLTGERFTVVGIMPPEFFGLDRGRVPDLWVPLAVDQNPGEAWVLGRLRPGVSIAGARAELAPLFHQALVSMRDEMKEWPEQDRNAILAQELLVNRATQGTSGIRWSFWDYSSTVKILIGLTGLILLIACMNLANLLTARSAARSGEIRIRLALGAGRSRLVRQLMTENILLALAGGVLGVLLAGWGHRILLAYLVQDPSAVALGFQLDYRVLGFGLGLSIATALLFGLLPAIRATSAGTSAPIHGANRTTGVSRMPFAKGLLAVQIGLTMVLLVGATLLARSLMNLGTADLGFARQNLLLMNVRPTAVDAGARQQFWIGASRRVSELPGVQDVALAGDAVFGIGGANQTIWIERREQQAQDFHVSFNLVSPGFFRTVGIPVLTGRGFDEQDRTGAPLVALVNQTAARLFFGDENPLGKRLGDSGVASSGRYEIVGVVGDAKYGTIREQTRPMVFYSVWQAPVEPSYVLHVRTATGSPTTVASIRREIQAADSEALITDLWTLPQIIRAQLRHDRMFAVLAGFFAGLALVLGALGIYGIVAYRVSHRTVEIGIRMALGAQKASVLWLVMRETLILLCAGAAIGVPAALAGTRLLRAVLFSLDPMDPVSIASAAVLLIVVALVAGYLPARRATRIHPMEALRSE